MKKTFYIILFLAIGFIFLVNGATSVSAQSQPKRGGILKINTPDIYPSFGYPLNLRGKARFFALQSLDRVIQRGTKMGEYEGSLAESFELAPDKSSYTFHLRKGVKFHDGTPFNAQAVKWNWDKLHAIREKRGIFKSVKSFEILDDHTLRANLSGWNVLMPEEFRDTPALIYSPTAFEKHGEKWANQHPVGAGPYIFEKYETKQKYVFKRNPDYWNKPFPYLDGIEFSVIIDPLTAQAAFLNGEVEGLMAVDAIMAEELMKKGYMHDPLIKGGNFAFTYNSKDPESIWSDIRMRYALEYAINKEEIAKSVGRNLINVSYEVLRGSRKTGDPGIEPRKFDPEKAKKLMTAAGYPNGLKVKMMVDERQYGDLCVALQHALGKVGIEVEIQVVAGPKWRKLTFEKPPANVLMYNRFRGAPGNGILIYANTDFASDSVYLPGSPRPAGFDDIMHIAMKEEDYQKRVSLMMVMEKMMYENAFTTPYFDIFDFNFMTPDIKWDKSIKEHYHFAQGDVQERWELIWLDR